MASRISRRARTAQQPSIFEHEEIATPARASKTVDENVSRLATLEAMGVSCAPLVAQRRVENPTVILPAEDANRFSEETWIGEPLKLILESARRDGEDALSHLRSLEAEIARSSDQLADAAQADEALQEIARAESETQAAWRALIEQVGHAVATRRVGQSITPALETYGVAIGATLGRVAQLPFWEAMREQTPFRKTGRGGKITQYPVHTGVEALQGVAPANRRILLDQYPSKVAPYEEVLASKNPRRALDYWRNAENYLCETGLIEAVEIFQELPRKGWKEQWLDTPPQWKPGARLRPTLEALKKNKHIPKPRSLQHLRAGRKHKNQRKKPENS